MNLAKLLKDQGYDLIEGPVRDHKLLQLWLKKDLDKAELYYSHISDAFDCEEVLNEIVNDALKINSTDTDEYKFNIGITILEDLLKALGLGNLGLTAKITSGKKVTISYGQSQTHEVAIGEIEDFLSEADFKHPNPTLLKNINRNDLLIISGIVCAKDLIVNIETDLAIDAGLILSLKEVGEGKVDFTSNNHDLIEMKSEGNSFFPVALKANRIIYNKSKFTGLRLLTDHREDLF
jgi:hypothetical protein